MTTKSKSVANAWKRYLEKQQAVDAARVKLDNAEAQERRSYNRWLDACDKYKSKDESPSPKVRK